MYLATGCLSGEVSLWDISSSPNCVATRTAPPIVDLLAFSRDGLYLAVASNTATEIWSVPSMEFVSCIRLEELDLTIRQIEFNHGGDQFLTFHFGASCLIQVWTTRGGVCEGSFEVRSLAPDPATFLPIMTFYILSRILVAV
jgi:WD40 repeat protein